MSAKHLSCCFNCFLEQIWKKHFLKFDLRKQNWSGHFPGWGDILNLVPGTSRLFSSFSSWLVRGNNDLKKFLRLYTYNTIVLLIKEILSELPNNAHNALLLLVDCSRPDWRGTVCHVVHNALLLLVDCSRPDWRGMSRKTML